MWIKHNILNKKINTFLQQNNISVVKDQIYYLYMVIYCYIYIATNVFLSVCKVSPSQDQYPWDT